MPLNSNSMTSHMITESQLRQQDIPDGFKIERDLGNNSTGSLPLGQTAREKLPNDSSRKKAGTLRQKWSNAFDFRGGDSSKRGESSGKKKHFKSFESIRNQADLKKMYLKGVVSFSNQINDSVTRPQDPNVIRGYNLNHDPLDKGREEQRSLPPIRKREKTEQFENESAQASEKGGKLEKKSGKVLGMLVRKKVKEILEQCQIEKPAHQGFLKIGQGRNMSFPALTIKETYLMVMPKRKSKDSTKTASKS